MANLDSYNDLRFFSNASIFKKENKENPIANQDTKEAIPFGLSMQEPFASENQLEDAGPSMVQSPTQTLTGPDSCLDLDIEF